VDPFFTTKGGEGSGLGLSMVYDQTTLAGGTLRMGNAQADGGAVVELRLPYRPAQAPAPLRMILLVEDNDDIRETVRELLRDLGHSVIEATSAEEAFDLLDLPGLDLVLSDIHLRGPGTGLDLALSLRDRGHGCAIALMTSLPAGNPLRQRAAEEFAVIAKPFDGPELARFLHRVP
jgi:CheY-like chemotaxis protein